MEKKLYEAPVVKKVSLEIKERCSGGLLLQHGCRSS